ncbi:MAG: twin-arginine translocation signal domain-containing protein [Gemmataceae bacterium]
MRRRDFLKTTAAVAATAATGPHLLGTTDKAGAKAPRVGSGEHTYECTHGWGELPGNLEWQTTHNVAIDADGLVYITHQGHKGKKGLDTVMVFDPAGKFVRSFGKEWHGGGHGIDFRTEGGEEFVYLTNTWTPKVKVCKTNKKGEIVWQQTRPECKEYENPKAAYNPTNIAFGPDGSFFVGDGYGANYMLKFDKDGKLLKAFGGSGKKDGQFVTPHGQWVDARTPNHPTLVVCDRANHRLQWFDLDGKFLKASKPDEMVFFPANIDTRGDVMLVPDLHTRISLFGKGDQPLAQLGDDDAWRKRVVGSLDKGKGPAVRTQPKEWPAGKFVHPHDACFDKDGNIFVAEWVEGGRITFLKKVG